MSGYYLANPRNLFTVDQVLFRSDWFLVRNSAAITPFTSSTYKFIWVDGIGDYIFIPLHRITLAKSTRYTYGVTVVGGAANTYIHINLYNAAGTANIGTAAAQRIGPGRVSLSFTTPAVDFMVDFSIGSGALLIDEPIVTNPTLTISVADADPGALPPTWVEENTGGYYISAPDNLLSPAQALFQNWSAGTVTVLPSSAATHDFAGLERIYLTPTATKFPLARNTTYTFGYTRVTGVQLLTMTAKVYNGSTQVGADYIVPESILGRHSVTFSTPDVAGTFGLVLDIYSAGSVTVPIVISGATLVADTDDPGPLPPVWVNTKTYDKLAIRIALYAPNGARYKTLLGANDIEASFPLSDVGALTFKYNKVLPNWASLTGTYAEVAVEYSVDGIVWTEPWGGRFYRMTEEDDDMEFYGETTLKFVSFGWLTKKVNTNAVVTLNADGDRPFNNMVGYIIWTILNDAHLAGVMTGLSTDFSWYTDSAGVAWDRTINIAYKPGTDLFTILANLTDQGIIEWTTDGRVLKVFNAVGYLNQDKSASVIYRSGYEITSAPNSTTVESMVSRMVAYGKDGLRVETINASAISPYGHQESAINQGEVTDSGTLDTLNWVDLSKGSAKSRQLTRTVDWKHATKFPFADFIPGWFIGVATVTDTATLSTPHAVQSLRVHQITLTYNEKDGVSGNLVLNNRFDEDQIKQAKRVNGIIGGTKLGGLG